MPFRLCNASATFQRLMNKILRPYVGKFVEVYLDNVIIHSRSKKEHIKHVRAVFQKIREANLKLNKEFFLAHTKDDDFMQIA